MIDRPKSETRSVGRLPIPNEQKICENFVTTHIDDRGRARTETTYRSYLLDFLRGTLAPARRASERPIAIACFRLFTLLPDRPLFNVPLLRSCIALFTFSCAFLPYLAIVILPFDFLRYFKGPRPIYSKAKPTETSSDGIECENSRSLSDTLMFS